MKTLLLIAGAGLLLMGAVDFYSTHRVSLSPAKVVLQIPKELMVLEFEVFSSRDCELVNVFSECACIASLTVKKIINGGESALVRVTVDPEKLSGPSTKRLVFQLVPPPKNLPIATIEFTAPGS